MLEIERFDQFVVKGGDDAARFEDGAGRARVGAFVPCLAMPQGANVGISVSVTVRICRKGARGDRERLLRFERRIRRQRGGDDAAQIVFEENDLDLRVGEQEAN